MLMCWKIPLKNKVQGYLALREALAVADISLTLVCGARNNLRSTDPQIFLF